MALAIPAGYTLQSQEKDTVTFVADATHSVEQPHLVIVDRKIPTFSNGGTLSQPTYRIRVIRGNLDADSNPIANRTLVECSFKWIAGQADTYVDPSTLAPLNAFLGMLGFAAEVFGKQTLPS